MSPAERERLLALKKKAKVGRQLEKEDAAFVLAMFEKWPAEFSEVDREVQEWARHWQNWL